MSDYLIDAPHPPLTAAERALADAARRVVILDGNGIELAQSDDPLSIEVALSAIKRPLLSASALANDPGLEHDRKHWE